MGRVAESVLEHMAREYGTVLPHHRMEVGTFANGETFVRVPDTVRRQHVFLFHPMQHPTPNDALVRLLLTNDALRRASVAGITLVLPYMTYLRQDRKDKPRVPISARLMADLIESNKSVERVITVDMHADQAQGFFSIPVDNMTTVGLFAEHLKARFGGALENVMVVSPDFGGVVRARRMAKKLGNLPVGIFEKRRPEANKTEVVSVLGDPIAGKHVVIYDDIVDTGNTIRGVVEALRELGARSVVIVGTHGIFSAGAEKKFAQDNFSVSCTDSVIRSEAYYAEQKSWLTVVSLEALLARAVHEASIVGGSVSKLST
jgi:ribose-phosphate pyrophosphokinase